MTATATAKATATATQNDRREVPGGGKLRPVRHIVRIVVVRLPDGSTPALRSDGPGQSDGLTDDELKMGEQALKGVDAAGLPITTSGKHVTMFDVLKPTDIVVMGSQPASVRLFNKDRKPGAHHTAATPNSAALPGEPPAKHLRPHDDRSGDTVLRVWTESDTIEYQCDEPFAIVGVKRAGWKIYDAPDNPFGFGEVKYTAQERKSDTDGKPIWVWTSGLLPARANNQQYKMTFRIGGKFKNGELVGGKLVDPDVVCGDPPPSA